jgi:hypothetical protein
MRFLASMMQGQRTVVPPVEEHGHYDACTANDAEQASGTVALSGEQRTKLSWLP